MMISLALGLAVGLILALTGAGGGILAVPLLVFGTHIGMAQAGPIGLLAVGMAACLGAVLGLRAGVVRYRAAVLVAISGMVCSPAGLWLARRVDNRWLSVLFAFTLLYVAFKTFDKARRKGAASTAARPVPVCVRDAAPARSRCPAPSPACCRASWASAAAS
jgi:uncharacterized membrane protein YfcA